MSVMGNCIRTPYDLDGPDCAPRDYFVHNQLGLTLVRFEFNCGCSQHTISSLQHTAGANGNHWQLYGAFDYCRNTALSSPYGRETFSIAGIRRVQ